MSSLNTYWLSRTPGATPEGPFTFGQLKAMYATGAINAEAQVCANSEEEWTEARWMLEEAVESFSTELSQRTEQRAPMHGKRKRKSKAGCGPSVLFLVGLVMCVIFWPVGLLLLFVALIIDHISYYTACSVCGNEVARKAKICGVCRANLR